MRPRPFAVLALLCLGLLACEPGGGGAGGSGAGGGGEGGGEEGSAGERTDASALAASFRAQADAVVAQQEADGTAATPLGRLLEECLAVDEAALATVGEALGIGGETAEVLNATLQRPGEADTTLSCAVRFGEASAGAVVLSAGPSDASITDLTAAILAADYTEVPDATAEGLAEDEVLLFEATGFEATRAVWAAEGFQISLTANADLADSGALLTALPVAVEQVMRVLG